MQKALYEHDMEVVVEIAKNARRYEDEYYRLVGQNEICQGYQQRISDAMIGTIRTLFSEDFFQVPNPTSEDQLFRSLTLAYALSGGNGPLIAERLSDMVSLCRAPTELRHTEREDPVACLLQLCYGTLALDNHLPTFLSPFIVTHQPERVEVQRWKDIALARTRIKDMDLYRSMIRDEKWISLALLQVELYGTDEDNREFIEQLLHQVDKRLKERKSKKLGELPAWGYRCLDHSLRIDLAIAQFKLRITYNDLAATIQNAFADCEYFLRSDYSFLKSWDTTDPYWTTEFWDLDCSSRVSSTLLSISTLDWHEVHSRNNGAYMTSINLFQSLKI
jgi:hypothetical protein